MANHHFSPSKTNELFIFLVTHGYPLIFLGQIQPNPSNFPWSNAMKSSFSQWNLQIFSSFWSVSSYFTPCFLDKNPPFSHKITIEISPQNPRLRGIAVHLKGIAGHGAGDGFGARPLQRHHGAAAQLKGARGALLRDTPNEFRPFFPWENVGKTWEKPWKPWEIWKQWEIWYINPNL